MFSIVYLLAGAVYGYFDIKDYRLDEEEIERARKHGLYLSREDEGRAKAIFFLLNMVFWLPLVIQDVWDAIRK